MLLLNFGFNEFQRDIDLMKPRWCSGNSRTGVLFKYAKADRRDGGRAGGCLFATEIQDHDLGFTWMQILDGISNDLIISLAS